MNIKEAIAWLKGERSTTNWMPNNGDNALWNVHIAQADAAHMQQAYWIMKAYQEGLST